MKRYLLFLSILVSRLCFSQSVSPQLIGSTGNFSTAAFGSISSSVGEPVTTTLGPAGGTILTQGFQQPQIQACPQFAGNPFFISPNDSVCPGTTVGIAPNLTTTSTGPYLYNWSSGQTTSAINVSPGITTTYTLIVRQTSPACSDTAQVTIYVSSINAAVTSNPPACGCNGSAGVSPSGGIPPYTYNWVPSGQTTQFVTGLCANQTVTITDSKGCSSSNNVSLPASPGVTVNTSFPSTICSGQSTTVGSFAAGNSLSYSWSPGGGTTNDFAVSPTQSTTYTVIVTHTSSGCKDTGYVSVTVTPAPIPTITASQDTVCQFKSVLLTAAGAATGGAYQWIGGPASATRTVNPSSLGNNTYTVVVSNGGGCQATASYTIFAKQLPNVSASAAPPTFCPGDTVTLTATSPAAINFVWFPGSISGPTIKVTPSGSITYTIGVASANGCTNFSTVPVTMDSISVNAGADMTICPGFTANLNAVVSGNTSGVNYFWSPDSLVDNPNVQNPSANPDTSTLFIITVTNGSCSASDSIKVHTIRTPQCVIHVYNGITPNGDNANSSWFIDGIQAYPDNNVLIFNRWGTRVWGGNGYNNTTVIWNGKDDKGQKLPDGTYYYLIELFDEGRNLIFSESKWVEVTH